MKKEVLFTIIFAGISILSNAQTKLLNWDQIRKKPQLNEKVLGKIQLDDYYKNQCFLEEEAYYELLKIAKELYKKNNIDIRYLISGDCPCGDFRYACWDAEIVEINKPENNLSKVLDKALMNVHEGSRLAIDIIKSTSEISRDELKDQVVDLLLDKGYKVVAKDYLEKLYEEQQAQQSGIYNEKTTVKGNNFSAVGYYINVKQSEESIKVQVINVSTGEYESNVTVALN